MKISFLIINEREKMDTKEIRWKRLSDEVTRKGGNGEAFVAAMKEQYAIHSKKVLVWLAGLYDPNVGGFYFSNSARDNEYMEYNGEKHILLPDIESTNQALGFLESCGFIKEGDYSRLPLTMQNKISEFVCSLEDPDDGFFYHPQWGKNITDNRRGRDHMWAQELRANLHFDFPYPTAEERLAQISDCISKGEKVDYEFPEHLKSKEAFIKYLDTLDWKQDAYAAGNLIAAQVSVIKAAGLDKVAVNYLDSIQNKENGMWGERTGYPAVNAHMKISCFYEYSENMIPNASKAVDAILETLCSDTPTETVCWQYNTWFSIQNILLNLRKFGGEAGNREADEIVSKVVRMAPQGIKANIWKVKRFMKPDGSCSYTPNATSTTSPGAFVAVNGANEGDVNATCINILGTIDRMYRAAELDDFIVPIFDDEDFDFFLMALGEAEEKYYRK